MTKHGIYKNYDFFRTLAKRFLSIRIRRFEVPANNGAKATVVYGFESLAGNFPKVTGKEGGT